MGSPANSIVFLTFSYNTESLYFIQLIVLDLLDIVLIAKYNPLNSPSTTTQLDPFGIFCPA